uniref:Uncharacterized protein n=1 Tax=Meloidogyne enterolobii TaxID=390850 RepID=A0A6V7ULX1_MELEN|nr:unnamed protein product [Meloidogyne enterolobii]
MLNNRRALRRLNSRWVGKITIRRINFKQQKSIKTSKFKMGRQNYYSKNQF